MTSDIRSRWGGGGGSSRRMSTFSMNVGAMRFQCGELLIMFRRNPEQVHLCSGTYSVRSYSAQLFTAPRCGATLRY